MIQKILKDFDDKATKLFTNGGLAVLMDYPPHDMVLDEKLVKAFLSQALTEQHEADVQSFREKIEGMKQTKHVRDRGFIGSGSSKKSQTGVHVETIKNKYNQALDDLLASLDEEKK